MTVMANRVSRRRLIQGVAAFSALAVAGGTLSACTPGGQSGPTADVKLDPNVKATISMSVWGMPWENDLYTKYYIPDFQKKYPNIKVEFNAFENYMDKLISLHAGGQMVDVPRLQMGFVPQFIDKKMLVPIDGYMKAENLDTKDFHPATWPPLTKDGKIYGIPQDLNFTGLYLNVGAFEKEGIPLPGDDYTLDKLTEDAKRLSKKDASGRVQQYGFIRVWNFNTGFWTLVYALGGKLWKDDSKTETNLDSPEVVEALEWQRKLCLDLQAAPTNAEMGSMGYAGMTDVLFQEGKAVMLQEGTHRSPSVQKNAPAGFKFKVVSHPAGKVKKIASGGQSFGVSSQSKAQDAAYLLASFMQTTESLIKYWIFTWVAPPARLSSMRSPDFKKIVGIPGTVPGVTSEDEFAQKCGWIPYSVEKEGFIQTEWVSPWYGTWLREGQAAMDAVLIPGSTVKAADALKKAAGNVNKYIQEELKK